MRFNRMASSRALALAALLLAACGSMQPTVRTATAPEATVERFHRLELTFELPQLSRDPDDVQVHARFTSPSGRVTQVEGFALEKGFAVRFAPGELGSYAYEIRANDGSGEKLVRSGRFASMPSDDPGIVHIDPVDPHRLALGGSPFVMLGENRINIYDPSWNYQAMGIEPYVAYMAKNGMNTLRVFVYSDCRVDGVFKPGRLGCLEPQLGRFDPQIARQFDAIFDAAEKHGVYVILTAFAIGFTPGDQWKGWSGNPYNAINGGVVSTPREVFTTAAGRKATERRLRYLLARYGASSHLLAVDLLNEPEWDGEIPEPVWIPWAEEMAARWRALDPYGHLVTAGSVGLHWNIGGDERPWYAAPANDLVEWHLYGKNIYEVHALAAEMSRKVAETWPFQKPIFCGEFAYGGEDTATFDHTHVGIWSLVMSGAGAVAHSAPQFNVDSDQLMLPARAAQFRTLARFLARVDQRRPLTPGHRALSDGAGAWWLARDDELVLWLLAPKQGYDTVAESPPVELPALRHGPYRVSWIDDVTGNTVRVDALRVDAPGIRLEPPRFKRHLAAIVTPENAPIAQMRTRWSRRSGPRRSWMRSSSTAQSEIRAGP